MIVEVNGIELHYQKYGEGEKELIMLHGNGEDSSIFKEIPLYMQSGFTVYLVDSRGHGKSQSVDTLHYSDMAQDIVCFIQELGLNKPILFGFSDGGIICLMIASKYPHLLSKIIVAGASLNPQGLKTKWILLMKMLNLFKKDNMLQLMLNEPNITQKDLLNIQIPVFVLAGQKDMIKERQTKAIAKTIKNSKLMILPKETHESYVLNNKKLSEYIYYFCDFG